ncbi:hypothetical protein, partial [Gorillibacterium massiliense]|uniref:hypothetical protein n=1 Tax=Gorillibacterium massiliense TaxID=1280390 RepID=UPI0012DCE161
MSGIKSIDWALRIVAKARANAKTQWKGLTATRKANLGKTADSENDSVLKANELKKVEHIESNPTNQRTGKPAREAVSSEKKNSGQKSNAQRTGTSKPAGAASAGAKKGPSSSKGKKKGKNRAAQSAQQRQGGQRPAAAASAANAAKGGKAP